MLKLIFLALARDHDEERTHGVMKNVLRVSSSLQPKLKLFASPLLPTSPLRSPFSNHPSR
jgi:hypothetical protein